eukprot:Trichotokara_eunicae@DN5373_c1_g1_i3.p1
MVLGFLVFDLATEKIIHRVFFDGEVPFDKKTKMTEEWATELKQDWELTVGMSSSTGGTGGAGDVESIFKKLMEGGRKGQDVNVAGFFHTTLTGTLRRCVWKSHLMKITAILCEELENILLVGTFLTLFHRTCIELSEVKYNPFNRSDVMEAVLLVLMPGGDVPALAPSAAVAKSVKLETLKLLERT